MTTYLGIDLAWGRRNRTGLAALDEDGRLVASGSVRTDEEIAAFVQRYTRDPVVVAVDAPLVVANATGRRGCEALVSREFGPYDAGAYPANRSNPHFDPPRAEVLAQRHGWAVDPAVSPASGASVVIEVYPHPAMITLFGLATVLPYKARPGRDLESLRAAFGQLLGHLERVCGDELRLADSRRWAELRAAVAGARRKSELGEIEDEVDAILCAYLAWLWGQADPRMRVLGDARDGYIVVPGRPSVLPRRGRREGSTSGAGPLDDGATPGPAAGGATPGLAAGGAAPGGAAEGAAPGHLTEHEGAPARGAVAARAPVREYRMTGVVVREHRLTVPADWEDPGRFPPVEVFAREIVDPSRAHEDLPLLLFLQGGPGGQGPRPLASGWWTTALRTHRVVLLDQRGTGRSSPVRADRLAALGGPQDQADYLALFRADSIVLDAEHLRRTVYAGRRWATLGQSYGGFVTLTYLSRHPEALTACYVTGGLPGITADAEEVYRRTVARQTARNRELRRLFPDDGATLDRLADRVAAGAVTLPDGTRLTVERLQMLGMDLGMSTGIEALHWLLDDAVDEDGAPTAAFCAAVERRTGFVEAPMYAVLHESIYHQGSRRGGWAAEGELARRPGTGPDARPLHLTGEVIRPGMFDAIPALRPFGPAAEALAARTEWPDLYDLDRLARNDVPLAAVQYLDDPYVDLDLALGTAERVGNAQVWVTNEYLHDGLRVAGDVILPRLVDLAAGRWSVTGR